MGKQHQSKPLQVLFQSLGTYKKIRIKIHHHASLNPVSPLFDR